MRCPYPGRCVQTFNGLSSTIHSVLKLNKYLSYKYIGSSADNESFFLQLAYILHYFSLLLVDKLSFRFPSGLQSYTQPDQSQALIGQRRWNIRGLLIPTVQGFITSNVIFMRTGVRCNGFNKEFNLLSKSRSLGNSATQMTKIRKSVEE